jgi:hypothetical protein
MLGEKEKRTRIGMYIPETLHEYGLKTSVVKYLEFDP